MIDRQALLLIGSGVCVGGTWIPRLVSNTSVWLLSRGRSGGAAAIFIYVCTLSDWLSVTFPYKFSGMFGSQRRKFDSPASSQHNLLPPSISLASRFSWIAVIDLSFHSSLLLPLGGGSLGPHLRIYFSKWDEFIPQERVKAYGVYTFFIFTVWGTFNRRKLLNICCSLHGPLSVQAKEEQRSRGGGDGTGILNWL